ncbi:hypothetical protein AX15_001480 [Amanita polypyramis BW_CC]|nr:hypothetical protein AX15_001480 [Amanita polypyramis BW_CC]
MSRQDKATTEKHARTLRELVKRPDNKVCADCKRNDPRWASWNIGVFLCIRCSGIHRGMGTHISKVKSVDLDVWTPEQMESIQKWGNQRANMYWEAHLKPGHIPPEHKMESFIRSKYESRRWAMDGPPPTDPSVLEQGISTGVLQNAPEPQEAPAPILPSRSSHAPAGSLSISRPAPPVTTRQTQTHQLLSASFVNPTPTNLSTITGTSASANPPAQTPITIQNTKTPAPENDLFSLDFHAPASTAQNSTNSIQSKKDVKQDILSLFSVQNPPTSTTTPVYNSFASQPADTSWTSGTANLPRQTSMIGTSGVGAWGATSGWTGVPPPQPNLWNTSSTTSIQPQQSSLFNTSEVWNTHSSTTSQNSINMANTIQTNKKDDMFGDLWGGFK